MRSLHGVGLWHNVAGSFLTHVLSTAFEERRVAKRFLDRIIPLVET